MHVPGRGRSPVSPGSFGSTGSPVVSTSVPAVAAAARTGVPLCGAPSGRHEPPIPADAAGRTGPCLDGAAAFCTVAGALPRNCWRTLDKRWRRGVAATRPGHASVTAPTSVRVAPAGERRPATLTGAHHSPQRPLEIRLARTVRAAALYDPPWSLAGLV